MSASVALAGLGGTAWAVAPFFWPEPTAGRTDATLMPVSDEIFDHQDNLFVFFLDSPEDILDRRDAIERVMRPLLAEESLHRLNFFHNVRKEGDPVVPEAGSTEAEEGPVQKPLKAVMYKGQRKVVINIGAELPLQEILDFYAPRSKEFPGQASGELVVQPVSGKTFQSNVIKASSSDRWILLQMFEDTCFLCFLMRPFINSIATLLAEQGAPILIKRLDIEKNDFPDGCPVARGTPTFVLFRGPQAAPSKWEEFKPTDLVGRLTKDLPKMDESVYAKMEEYQELVSQRFRLFTQLVFWTVELGKIQMLVSAPPAAAGVFPGPVDGGKKDDAAFNNVVAHMMSRDMKRTDGIHDNLKFLQREVDEVEHDCALLGMMLGQSILERERQTASG